MVHQPLRGRLATVIVCAFTVLLVAACGSSNVSAAVKNKMVNGLVGDGVPKAKAETVVNCLVPTFKAHHLYTVADGKKYGNSFPSWAQTAAENCAKKAGISLGS